MAVFLKKCGTGTVVTYTDWGLWVPLYGVGVWLAVRGLRREVY